eukprot:TRINITY_DN151_c0_g1_i1.p1 TRINITY_DN151_c0_g1~~TRINITY_DN151_c0_g1_i1.p1  ORF type:complete len:211 (-),score=30.01 TRINITY_DN151_c0_g1_i1:54-686(-)
MNFIFACLAATLCAKADRVDSGKVWLEQPKLDEVAECIPDTGGHCNGAEGSCNEDHGKTDCRDDKCFCKPGFCAMGETAFKRCQQTCGSANFVCNTTELTQNPSYVCCEEECDRVECCIEKARCDGGRCNPATDIPLTGNFCQGLECTAKECCLKRGNCNDFLCPQITHLDAMKAGQLCKQVNCMVDECCSLNGGMPMKRKPAWLPPFPL